MQGAHQVLQERVERAIDILGRRRIVAGRSDHCARRCRVGAERLQHLLDGVHETAATAAVRWSRRRIGKADRAAGLVDTAYAAQVGHGKKITAGYAADAHVVLPLTSCPHAWVDAFLYRPSHLAAKNRNMLSARLTSIGDTHM